MSEPPFWVELSKNPKGIPPQSPGLRGTSYPGLQWQNSFQPRRGCGPIHFYYTSPMVGTGHNPFRVVHFSTVFPRVARSSQPWAGGHNPFGIGKGRMRAQDVFIRA